MLGRFLLLALATAAFLAGCGGNGDDIPPEDAETLLLRLNEVEGAVEAGRCEGARSSANLLISQVAELPERVDEEVRQLLQQGSTHLVSLVSEQCEPTEPAEEPPPAPAPPEPEPLPPVEPPDEEPEEEEEEQEAPPRNDQQGGEGGAGGGNPGGGRGRGNARGDADGGTRASG